MEDFGRREFRSEAVRKEMERLKRRRRRRRILLIIILGTLLILVAGITAKSVFIDNRQLEITNYNVVSDKINSSVRLVIMSDLHNGLFGEKNEQLISAVQALAPDVILMAGDMVNYSQEDVSVVLDLCTELVEIAPVYYALGNHEGNLIYTKEKIPLDKYLYNLGVHFMYTNYELVTLKDNVIKIGAMAADAKTYDTSSENFIKEFEEGDAFKILINHYPDLFTEKLNNVNVELGVAGHYHGGLIRVPGIGGLYHWDTGFFPEYDGGKYPWGDGELIVTRGLGNHGIIPRINNKPELVVVDIGQ